jgi:hypothetical protein
VLSKDLGSGDVAALLQMCPPEKISVWMTRQKTGISEKMEVKGSMEAALCYDAGASVSFPAVKLFFFSFFFFLFSFFFSSFFLLFSLFDFLLVDFSLNQSVTSTSGVFLVTLGLSLDA